jgi:hypothetical protein
MKSAFHYFFRVVILGTAALALPIASPNFPASAAAATLSIEVFYESLAPYGSWVQFHGGYVFVPKDTPPGWRPYTLGRWVYADQVGWLWISDEPFGWATYHYGRWAYSDEIGWYWIPGRLWAPAWVTWRRTPDYIIWAPLPPNDDDDLAFEISIRSIPDYCWNIVPARSFLDDLRVAAFVETSERERYLHESEEVGSVVVQNNVVVDSVLNANLVRQMTGRKFTPVRIEAISHPQTGAMAGSGTVAVFQAPLELQKNAKPATVEAIGTLRERQAKRPDKPKGSVESMATVNQVIPAPSRGSIGPALNQTLRNSVTGQSSGPLQQNESQISPARLKRQPEVLPGTTGLTTNQGVPQTPIPQVQPRFSQTFKFLQDQQTGRRPLAPVIPLKKPLPQGFGASGNPNGSAMQGSSSGVQGNEQGNSLPPHPPKVVAVPKGQKTCDPSRGCQK